MVETGDQPPTQSAAGDGAGGISVQFHRLEMLVCCRH